MKCKGFLHFKVDFTRNFDVRMITVRIGPSQLAIIGSNRSGFDSTGSPASVDEKHVACDHIGGFRRQIDHRSGDILSLRYPA